MTACLAELGMNGCALCRGEDIITRAGPAHAEASLCKHLSQCKTCGGTGFLRSRDAAGYEVMGQCARGGIARRVTLFNEMALPARFHEVRLASFDAPSDPQNNQRQLRKLVERVRDDLIDAQRPDGSVKPGVRGLGLSGTPGVGKTHLLCALARELTLEHGCVVRYADFSTLLWDLKSRFEQGSGEAALLAPLIDADVLVLDEVGKGKASEWDISIVDALVAGRYNRQKTIVFATNFALTDAPAVLDFNSAAKRAGSGEEARKLETLKDRISGRVYSRLLEMCELVTVKGPDHRSLRPADAARSAR